MSYRDYIILWIATNYLFPAFFAVSAVCAWSFWFRLPEKFPRPKHRGEAGLVALVAGTLSGLVYFVCCFRLFKLEISSPICMDAGMLLAAIAFVLSFFSRKKLRIADIVLALSLWPLWGYQLYIVTIWTLRR